MARAGDHIIGIFKDTSYRYGRHKLPIVKIFRDHKELRSYIILVVRLRVFLSYSLKSV